MELEAQSKREGFVLVLHGGAGVLDREDMVPELARDYKAGLTKALEAGRIVLESGGASLDAVVATVAMLEDDPLFNAGRGAAFTSGGENELDAAVMDGATMKAGAVTLVRSVKNPIRLARLVMERTRHVMLAGEGAEALARKHGLETVEVSYFATERRWNALQRLKKAEQSARANEVAEADKHGTVGAVALDAHGNLAAATSTGGYTNKLTGRVGDTPLIGAGTYAENATAAVSCTGEGEYFIRACAAHTVSTLMEFKGWSVEQAAHVVIHERLAGLGGAGGLIALDRRGNFTMPFSTPGMYRAYVAANGASAVEIFR